MLSISLVEGITFAIAVLGAVLGIINTVHSINKDRVRLKVTPSWIIIPGDTGQRRMGIEITNTGFLPVTISEAGFAIKGKKRMVFVDPLVMDGGSWSRRLEPRSSFTLLQKSAVFYEPEFATAKHAYAKTQCGKKFKGKTAAFKQAKRMWRRGEVF